MHILFYRNIKTSYMNYSILYRIYTCNIYKSDTCISTYNYKINNDIDHFTQ